MSKLHVLSLLALMFGAVGCVSDGIDYSTEDRLNNGLIVILPGIEGESPMNHDIRAGLVQSGAYRALPIYAWGRPVPLAGPLLNQVDFIGNRLAGNRIADMIVQYQNSHPGRPVYIVGHSGGGGVAVFAAEAMPEGHKIDGLVLLSASISGNYDLTKALNNCKCGLVNFYNPSDVGLLGIGTTVAGNVDGGRAPSAGRAAFAAPDENKPGRAEAYAKLFQVEITDSMTGGGDPHVVATEPHFVSTYVSRWVLSDVWPAGNATAGTMKW